MPPMLNFFSLDKFKRFIGAFFAATLCFFMFSVEKSSAFEGTIEMKGKTDARCFAASVFMNNSTHKLVISCVNLVYPPATDRFAYVLWGTPINSKVALKIGSLNTGKGEFTFNPTLTSMYVTIERHDGVRTPSKDVIMSGTPQPITFLTENQEPIKTIEEPTPPVSTVSGQAENFGEIIEGNDDLQNEEQQTRPSILNFFRQGGILLAVGGFIFLIVLAFLTRARG
jgi:hypothetical protein